MWFFMVLFWDIVLSHEKACENRTQPSLFYQGIRPILIVIAKLTPAKNSFLLPSAQNFLDLRRVFFISYNYYP